jgi:lipoate---protein ligase
LAQCQGIPILRRFSGGGTVYHDLGNVNYSLHRDKLMFNRTFAAEMIIKALKDNHPIGIGNDFYLSSRHDIFYKTDRGDSFKVSGSAYKLSKDRAYHHGTLLLSTELSKISSLLKSNLNILKDEKYKFGGVSSVPSPVTNIPNLSFETLLDIILKEFKPTDSPIEISESSHNNEIIQKYKEDLESWNWTFGKSPPFKLIFNNEELIIESGRIKEASNHLEIVNKKLNEIIL